MRAMKPDMELVVLGAGPAYSDIPGSAGALADWAQKGH